MIRTPLFALLLLAMLAGCGAELPPPGVTVRLDDDQENVLRHIDFDGDRISVSLPDGRRAGIDATGALAIDGRRIALTDSQRELAQRFHVHAHAVREEGLAVGRAGAEMAGDAVGSVLTSLVQGEPDSIRDRIDADAAPLKARAVELCRRTVALQAAQVELARAVPAFQPHPVKAGLDAADCR